MRRLPATFLILFAAVAFVACSSSAAPGWTYAPALSASPAASGAASGGPSAGASAPASVAPSAPASAAPSAAPSESAGESAAASGGAGLTVTAPVSAATSGFDPTTLETAAGTPFTLTFHNEDNTVQHNLVLENPDKSLVTVDGDTSFFTGPGDRAYKVPALTPGDYPYLCQVHPTTMHGTLTVK